MNRKNILIILTLILINLNLTAININFQAELGLIPQGTFMLYETDTKLKKDMSFYGDIYSEVSMFKNNFFFIGIDLKLYAWRKANKYTFHIDSIDMMFTTGFRWKCFEVGFRHYCQHPIITWIEENYTESLYERWYEEVYIKVNVNFNINRR